MSKRMRMLLNKSMIMLGVVALSLVPAYANAEIETPQARVIHKVQNSTVDMHGTEYRIGNIPKDNSIAALINLNGNEFIGIFNEGKKLYPGIDYTRENGKDSIFIELEQDYLRRQSEGDLNLTFEFNRGESQQVTIKILPMKTQAEFIGTSFCIYDCERPNSTVGALIKRNKDTLVDIYSKGKDGKYEKKLGEADYTVQRSQFYEIVEFTDEFIKKLPVGKSEVVFEFEKADPVTFLINVLDKGKTVKVDLEKSTEESSNTINNSFKFTLDGKGGYKLSDLKVRYYYTADDESEQNVSVDNAAVNYSEDPWYEGITDNVKAEIVKMENPTDTADTYLELSFTNDALLDNKTAVNVDTRINKSDWSNYDQSNDYSYAKPENVCVYYNDQLISGVEPN